MPNKRLSKEKQALVLSALCEGAPIEACARMFKVGTNTITRVIRETGEECQCDPRERNLVLWLKSQRVKQGLSAAKLATKAGLSRACITHIEANRCRPTLATLLKMSDGLGLNQKEWQWDLKS